MTVYSSSTSLILTDLLTRGQNYSFAVAVTDSTGQHGPWSDQLMVTWDGKILYIESFITFYVYIVLGPVFNISWRFYQNVILIADWEVKRLTSQHTINLFSIQPPSPTHPPVLYYTVTHNVR